MKIYISLFVLFLLMACSQKQDAVYGEGNGYLQRTNETITQYTQLLESSPNGWLLSLYPGENQIYGGYNCIVSFSRGKVTAISEVSTTTATSEYSLIFNEKAVLSFDTFNEVLHHFVQPSFLFPHGKQGDNQFEIVTYKNGIFTLKGKRSFNTMTLTPFYGSANSFLQKIRLRENQLKTVGITPINLEGKEVTITLHPTNHQLVMSNDKDYFQKAFIYTEKGLKLYEPITIGNHTFDEFYISEDNNELSTPDRTIKTSLVHTLPFDFLKKELVLNLFDDGCSTNPLFAKLYKQYNSFTNAGYTYKISPQISLGVDHQKPAGITFYGYQGFETRYTFDFLPVAGKSNQVQIVEGIRSDNWNYTSSLYPIVEAILQNAPYEMTDVNGDGSQYKFTSVKKNDVSFLSFPQTFELPYDFNSRRTTLYFEQGEVCEVILDAFNKIKVHIRQSSSSGTITETLSTTGYFGYRSNNIGLHFISTRSSNNRNYSTSYGVDFIPVPCDGNQINLIDKGKLTQNTNWTTYSYIAPLVAVFTENAPYKVEDQNDGYLLCTSVKNSNIWFYVLK